MKRTLCLLGASLVSLATILISGCSSTGDAVRSDTRKHPVQIQEGSHTVALEPDQRSLFLKTLQKELYDPKDNIVPGDQYTLRWHPVVVDEGSRALRYFVGFGAGRGEFTVDAELFDASGNSLRRFTSEGDQSMGMYGGSYDGAIEESAERLADRVKEFLAR